MSTLAIGGYSYFITFIDDFSRYKHVYLMKYKSEAFEKFREYKNEVENQTGKSIKTLRSDQGGEYRVHLVPQRLWDLIPMDTSLYTTA
ncbi:unnamed protein product [Musa textilis]